MMAALAAGICLSANSEEWKPAEWPVLRNYDGAHLEHISLPLGGIGTGTVSLGGRGELRDWQIMNVPAIGYSTILDGNNAPFFAIYTRPQGGEATTKLLAGPLYPHEMEAQEGCPVNHHGFPRFAKVSFEAAYPFGQVSLSDEAMPVKVRIKGFNPLIPCNSEDSGIPVAVLSYEVTNVSDVPVDVAVCGSLRNFIGRDGTKYTYDWKLEKIYQGADRNVNEFKDEASLKGLHMTTKGVDPNDPAWGDMALTTISDGEVTSREYSTQFAWEGATLNFWDDFSDDGLIRNPVEDGKWKLNLNEPDPMGSLSVKKSIAPGETGTFTFLFTWRFPNRKAWSSAVLKNYYSEVYPDSWAVATRMAKDLPQLEKATLDFVNSFLSTTYPEAVKEAALFNLSVLRSQTVFRLSDGNLFGWEGVMQNSGACYGNCTHVWNYEEATAFLFGDLARSMRSVEFLHAMRPDGSMDFRVNLPLDQTIDQEQPAADGQMGCIMKLYRDWQLCGSKEFLEEHWPGCKAALEYAWKEGSWDGNCDGVMEGSQHNTMDVNYFGPNPQMGFWYLGALRAAEEMAMAMGDKAFAKKCKKLFASGSEWVDANLFNGEYYEQKITDPATFEFLPEDAREIPQFQLGRGCLVDQLVGQYMAHICGLGYLADESHMKTTLESIFKYNFKSPYRGNFNNMRSYLFEGESGLLMASWPNGRLAVPFPYFSESMTGFEYCAATGMLFEGMESEGLKCIEAIRNRFDGQRRNPFDEPECGHFYARSMASWAPVVAMSGFNYSAVGKSFAITDKSGKWFWSNGSSYGTVTVVSDSVSGSYTVSGSKVSVTLEVISGSLIVSKLVVGGKTIRRPISLHSGETLTIVQ